MTGQAPPPSRRRRLLRFLSVFLIFAVLAVWSRESVIDWFAGNLLHGSPAEWQLLKTNEQLGLGVIDAPTARRQLIRLANENPRTSEKLQALFTLARRWETSDEGQTALRCLPAAVIESSIRDVATATRRSPADSGPAWYSVADALVQRVHQSPNHPDTGQILSTAASIRIPGDDELVASEELVDLAATIVEVASHSPDLMCFCDRLFNRSHPRPWMRPFEPVMRSILDNNNDRLVRCSATFALGTIIRAGGPERQQEAVAVFEQLLEQFDGSTKYHGQAVERHYRVAVNRILKSMREHGVCMPAPRTAGIDLDGHPVSLADFRGRVVLLTFWASWCRPCLEAVAKEKSLLSEYAAQDFAVLGMNADSDIDAARRAAEKYGMTWPSLRTTDQQFSNPWTVHGYPTLIVIDRQGKIAASWTGLPHISQLAQAIEAAL